MNGTDRDVTEGHNGQRHAPQAGMTQEIDRELSELRREVLEARNQAIRTDNQVTNLALDLKGIDRRIEQFARKARFAGFGATLVVAAVVASGSFIAHNARVNALESEITQYRAQAAGARTEADTRIKEAAERLTELEQEAQRRATTEGRITELFDDLDAGRETHAVELIAQIDAQNVTPLTRRLAKPRLDEFRSKASEKAYRNARSLLSAGKTEDAYTELRRGLRIAPAGGYALQSRYLLATTLWSNKRFDETVSVAREILQEKIDNTLATEVRFVLGTALARLNRLDEAAEMLREVIRAGGSYGSAARSYLSAIESGQELPALR